MPFSGSGTGIQNADDVFFSSLGDGQTLRYDSGTAKWNNAAAAIGSAGPSIIVASDSAPQSWKDAATYLCDGVDDDVEINQAINDHSGASGTSNTYTGQAVVLLSPGNFSVRAPINVKSRVWLRGAARGATLLKPASGHTAIGVDTTGVLTITDPLGPPYDQMAITDLSVHGGSLNINGFSSYFTQGDASKDDNNLGGSPDTNNILRDLTFVSCGRSGMRIAFNSGVSGAASTSWRIDHVRVFGCGDSGDYAGFDIAGTDCWLTNCDVGSQGGSGTTSTGFRLAGSDNSAVACIAWTTKGTGFVITGSKWRLVGCMSHHSTLHGFESTGNRNIFTGCIAYNNATDGFRISANTNTYEGCQSFDDGDSFAVAGRPQSTGFNITNAFGNSAGNYITGTTFAVGDAMEPVAGAHMDDPTSFIKVLHTGAHQDGSSGTRKVVSYEDGLFVGSGTGSPEGAVAAKIGSTYRRKDGGVGTTFYVKESGTGATGWTAVGA